MRIKNIESLATESSIPKKIHMTWKNNNVEELLQDQNPMIQNGLRNIIEMNPDWDFEISNDDQMLQYLKDGLESSDYRMIETADIVARSDVWRLLKVYKEGGLYMDIDRFYNIPLHNIIKTKTKMLLPIHMKVFFSQDVMCSYRGNQIYEKVINKMFEERKTGVTNILYLAVHVYSKVMMKELLDVDVKIPFETSYKQVYDMLSKCEYIETCLEGHMTQSTMFFEMNDETWRSGNGRSKANWYKEQQTQHWKKRYRDNGK